MKTGTHAVARTDKPAVLVVEPDLTSSCEVSDGLRAEGFEVLWANSARSCLALQENFDIVLSEYSLPDGTALELRQSLGARGRAVPFIVMAKEPTIELAVRSIKEGAEHFVPKPLQLPALSKCIDDALKTRRRTDRSQDTHDGSGALPPYDPFIGSSRQINRVAETAVRLLSTSAPILIQGETGTGKGVLARWFHENGPRAQRAFIDLNCAGLSDELLESELFGYRRGAFTGTVADKPGLFEAAHRGSVFLDEIGDLKSSVQPKLLKVVEDKRFRRLGDVQDRLVDVKLIAATHQDLSSRVAEGQFREDLYFRLNMFTLRLPPLRERPEDILPIARALLSRLSTQIVRTVVLSDAAEQRLRAHAWPGNIRELRNTLERALALSEGPEITVQHLGLEDPLALRAAPPRCSQSLEDVQRSYIRQILEEECWNVTAAAARLAMPRSTLYSRLKEFNMWSKPGREC